MTNGEERIRELEQLIVLLTGERVELMAQLKKEKTMAEVWLSAYKRAVESDPAKTGSDEKDTD